MRTAHYLPDFIEDKYRDENGKLPLLSLYKGGAGYGEVV